MKRTVLFLTLLLLLSVPFSAGAESQRLRYVLFSGHPDTAVDVTQISEQGDFVAYGKINQSENSLHRLGFAIIAVGPDAATVAARNNLPPGVPQIKTVVEDGVSSEKELSHSSQYSNEEIRWRISL